MLTSVHPFLTFTYVYFSLQTPTLIVYGALDTNLGAQSHKNLIQLPNHFVLKLEGARHACYMDKPQEFHQGLVEFLSKLTYNTQQGKMG